jgi:hypothetical protein
MALETRGADSSVPHGSTAQDWDSDRGSAPRNSMSLCWQRCTKIYAMQVCAMQVAR